MTKLAVQALADLTGVTLPTALRRLDRAAFVPHGTTRGGYSEFRHLDGSVVWIRPSGEVIRLGPRVAGVGGKKYRPRFDQYDTKTSSHSTGELLAL